MWGFIIQMIKPIEKLIRKGIKIKSLETFLKLHAL